VCVCVCVIFNDAVNYHESVPETLVEWYCQGKAEVLGEKPVQLPICQPQFEQGLAGD